MNKLLFPIIVVVVLGASWASREIKHQRIDHGSQWVTHDPDSLYHLRRVERVLSEGLPIAETDSYLNFPEGSPIPWPPYYTRLASTVLGPFAPEDAEALRVFVETKVANLPLVFGVLTSLLAALAGRLLAGNFGALIAGTYHALCVASIAYSKSGNGDHHAWITFLAGLTLVLLTRAIQVGALERARTGAVWGALVGVTAGLALGSWIASLLYVVPIQIALGWLVIRHARRPLPGLPQLGLAFHVAAFLTLLPATLTSAWNDINPWMVVNLSWFHSAWLLLGGAVFVPLLFLRPRSGAFARYPEIVVLALALLGVFLALSNVPPAAGIREGFAWLGREDDFMASVWESRGLIGEGSAYSAFDVLGYGLALLPLAWAGVAWMTFRRGRLELLPWAVSLPLLFAEALRQFRFADALALPMAVILGWGMVSAARSGPIRRRVREVRWLRRPPGWALVLSVVTLVALAEPKSAAALAERLFGRTSNAESAERPSSLAMRGMCDWIRRHTPASGDYSVLAPWFWGHMIEWAADRPSVATNFGSYVGEESFQDPSRFFLLEDPAEAEALLSSRRSRYVALTTDLTGGLRKMITSVAPEKLPRYMDPGRTDGINIRVEWFQTLGARLMFDGAVLSQESATGRPLDFLRLVHVSPMRDRRYNLRGGPSPYGWVWEHVPGAILEARGRPGEEMRVEIRMRYPGYELVFADRVVANAQGVARLRVPYTTEGENGDGRPAGPARWSLGERSGTVSIPERAVTERGVLRIS